MKEDVQKKHFQNKGKQVNLTELIRHVFFIFDSVVFPDESG